MPTDDPAASQRQGSGPPWPTAGRPALSPAPEGDTATPSQIQAVLDHAFLRPMPVILGLAGLLTFGTAPWVTTTVDGPDGTTLAAGYAVMGVLVLMLAAWFYKARPPAAVAYPMVSLLACLFLIADLSYVRATGQAQFNSQLWLLLGSGFLLLRTRWLHPVMAVAAAGWMALFWPQRADPVITQFGLLVLASIFFGYLAHLLRVYSLRRVAVARLAETASRQALESTLEESRLVAQRLQVLTEASPLGIFHTTVQGTVDYANARWCEIAGCDFRDMTAIRNAVHPEDLDALSERWRACLAQGTELAAEFRYVHASGQVRHVATRAMPVRDATGAVTGYAGTLEDISGRKQAAHADRIAFERLLEIEQLKEIDRFKTSILNATGHELNTPITPLKLQLHLLAGGTLGPLNERQQKAVQVLDRNVTRLSNLVSDVLDVARLQGGHLRLECQPVDLGRALAEAVESFAEPARSAKLALTLEAPEGLSVHADPLRISQVFYNLISNALKFTPEGGSIRISASPLGDQVEVRVTDTGVGLRPEQVARLFQPFSQVHDDARLRQQGTGLGLYISKAIVEQHGGQLDAESPGPGKGATFRLALAVAAWPEGGKAMVEPRIEV